MAATQPASIPQVSDASALYGTPDEHENDIARRMHDCNVALTALGERNRAAHERLAHTAHYRVACRLHVSGHYAAKVSYEAVLALALDAGKDVLVLAAGVFVKLEEMQSAFTLLGILLALLVAARVLVKWAEHDED